jgi:aldehyde dehydrogenase (NAD+)
MDQIANIFQKQLNSFSEGHFRSYEARKEALLKLKSLIIENEQKIVQALYEDLGKGEFEAIVSETLFVINEIDYTLKNLKGWMKKKRVSSPFLQFPSRSYIVQMPIGPVLVISPWNYPFQLLLSPAVGAIAAGNPVVLKPSEITPNTSALIAKLINTNFNQDFLHVVEGAIPETQALLERPFAHIFYTGNAQVGRIVMEKAAKSLTPVTLELGGKSPCFIYGDCDLDIAAKRVTWTKFLNAGQTCVAPDYVLLPKDKKKKFILSMKKYIEEFYKNDFENHSDFGRIVNEKHYDRLVSYIKPSEVILGGRGERDKLFIEPTVLEANQDSPCMQDEIFGPLLPIIEIDDIDTAINFVNRGESPLAAYVFSSESKIIDKVVNNILCGGMTINDCVMHLTSHNLPFGGVGNSGIGSYHGKKSFDIFSHQKSVLHRGMWPDLPLRYPPYKGKLKLLRWLMSWIS